jgi:hypothetical protein
MADKIKMMKHKLEEKKRVCEEQWKEKYCFVRIKVASHILIISFSKYTVYFRT